MVRAVSGAMRLLKSGTWKIVRDVVTQNQQSTNRIWRRIIDPVVRVAKPVPIVRIQAVPEAGRYWFAVDRDGAQRASIDSTCDGKILNFCPLRRLKP